MKEAYRGTHCIRGLLIIGVSLLEATTPFFWSENIKTNIQVMSLANHLSSVLELAVEALELEECCVSVAVSDRHPRAVVLCMLCPLPPIHNPHQGTKLNNHGRCVVGGDIQAGSIPSAAGCGSFGTIQRCSLQAQGVLRTLQRRCQLALPTDGHLQRTALDLCAQD